MSNRISISESEWQVMKIIWNDPPQTLQEILEKLKHTDWSKTTIQTYIARLVKKGALSTKRQGKGYLYYPRPHSKNVNQLRRQIDLIGLNSSKLKGKRILSFLCSSCFVILIPALESESFSQYFLSAKRASQRYL